MLNMDAIQNERSLQKNMLQRLEAGCDPKVKGSLAVQRSASGKARYYHVTRDPSTHKKVYKRLSAEDAALVETLRANSLYGKWADPVRRNLKLMDKLSDGYTDIPEEVIAAVVPLVHSERAVPDRGKSPFDWETLKASAGKFRPEGLIYEAEGQKFRSKGEAIHAMCFANAGLDYIYEPEIDLGGICLHPDFAVRSRRTGRIYFWEVFGMLDVKEYRESFFRKLPALMELGIIPGYNLICTCEFKGVCELSISDINAKIRAYLL
jgi:hypothetical protein